MKPNTLFDEIRESKLRLHPFEENKGKVLMIGSSFFQLWPNAERDFAPVNVLNLGINGTRLKHWIRYIDSTVMPYVPQGLIIYAGSNDFNEKANPDDVIKDLRALANKIKTSLPNIPVLYVGICPTISKQVFWDDIRSFNQKAERLCRKTAGFHYIDSAPAIFNPDGTYRDDIYMDDLLHLNDKGYDCWREALIPAVKAVFLDGAYSRRV